MHSNRCADAILSVDHEASLDDVDDLAVVRDGYCLSSLESAAMSNSSITPPEKPTKPLRQLTEATCEPARLTRC